MPFPGPSLRAPVTARLGLFTRASKDTETKGPGGLDETTEVEVQDSSGSTIQTRFLDADTAEISNDCHIVLTRFT